MAPKLLSFLGSVYDLDTLDTRFTTPSSIPYSTKSSSANLAGDRQTSSKRDERGATASLSTSPPRWATAEFYLYYLVFLVAVPYMFWVPYTVSRRMLAPSDPRWASYLIVGVL